MTITTRPATSSLRDALSVVELFLGVFRRDLLGFYPQSRFEPVSYVPDAIHIRSGPDFQLIEEPEEGDEAVEIGLFGVRYRLTPRDGGRFTAHDRRMIRAIGAVLCLRYHHLFHIANESRLELFRGGSEDHYVAAFIDPPAYAPSTARPSRIASTILTLRTAALSTYENRRVSTGSVTASGPCSWSTARGGWPTSSTSSGGRPRCRGARAPTSRVLAPTPRTRGRPGPAGTSASC